VEAGTLELEPGAAVHVALASDSHVFLLNGGQLRAYTIPVPGQAADCVCALGEQ
jgi:hypothetical protein